MKDSIESFKSAFSTLWTKVLFSGFFEDIPSHQGFRKELRRPSRDSVKEMDELESFKGKAKKRCDILLEYISSLRKENRKLQRYLNGKSFI